MTSLFLIDPPRAGLLEGASHGLTSLANWIERNTSSVSVTLLDWSALPFDRIPVAVFREVRAHKQIVVGITCATATYQSALAVAQIFRVASDSCVIVLGGHHATPEAEVILRAHQEIDIVVRGEGERPLLDLVLGVPWSEIPGLCYRKDSGEVATNPPPVPLGTSELDSIASCFHQPRSESGKFGRCCIVTARGCPLACRFCVVGQQPVRSRSIPRVIEDLRELISGGYDEFTIEDNFFAQSPRRTIALCEAIAELQKEIDHRFIFDCQTRIESCSETVVSALAAAGCDAVYLGVEALTVRQLTFLGKTAVPGHFLKQLHETAIPLLFDYGIEANLNLQIGVPHTTMEEMEDTLRGIEAIGEIALDRGGVVRFFPHLHVIYPGTPEFKDGLATGVFPRDIFERFTEWEAAQNSVLDWMGRRFAHGAGGLPIEMLEPDALRDGEFVLLPERIYSADNFVNRMGQIDGVEVFDYAAHLVSNTEPGRRVRANDFSTNSARLPSPGLASSHLLQTSFESAGD